MPFIGANIRLFIAEIVAVLAVDLVDTWSVWRVPRCHVCTDLSWSDDKIGWRTLLSGWQRDGSDLVSLAESWSSVNVLGLGLCQRCAFDELSLESGWFRLPNSSFLGPGRTESIRWWGRFLHPHRKLKIFYSKKMKSEPQIIIYIQQNNMWVIRLCR